MAADLTHLRLDHQLCFALHSASRAVVRAYAPLLDDLGLTYPQYLTMLVLWEDPSTEVSVGDLGDRLRLDSGTLTPLLKRLERSGLVHRNRDETDERRVLVGLSKQGLQLRQRARSVPGALAAKTGLNLETAKSLKADLERLIAALDDEAVRS